MTSARLVAPLSLLFSACPAALVADGGADAGMDAGKHLTRPAPDASIEHLPLVVPSGKTCPEDAGTVCVAEGWFQLSQWSTRTFRTSDGGWMHYPTQTVYLDQFLLDATEVTNEHYLRYLAAAGATPPPPWCGCTNEDFFEDPAWYTVAETSGWTDAGTPEAGREQQPVVCVTRREAMAFCAWRGGRLPTVAEFMKAARGGFPSVRRTPWGDEPPSLDDSRFTTLPPTFFVDYLAANLRARGVRGVGVQNVPNVGSRSRGVSEAGLYDLTGSVSEFAAECLEQLGPVYGSDPGSLLGTTMPPLIRPDAGPARSECTTHFLVVGDNWFSSLIDLQVLGSVSVYSRAGAHLTAVGDRSGGADDVMGAPDCAEPPGDPGNSRRSWSIGFRCAYDTPPSR